MAKNMFTVIEFGTSKIGVLHGICDSTGKLELLGFGQRPSDNSIIKGSIVNYDAVTKILEEAIADADKSASGVPLRRSVYFLMSGAGVSSRKGDNCIHLHDAKKVDAKHIDEVTAKAQNISFSSDQCCFDSYISYYTLDGHHRVKSPENQVADTLEAHVHMILAGRKDVEKIQHLLREFGYEKGGIPVFSGIASAYAALSEDDREKGALLIDFGAGVCDYVLIHQDGVLLSGVLPIGMDNLANDLAVGLDLPIDYCRKFLRDGTFDAIRASGQSIVEVPGLTSEKVRRIPVISFEKILYYRLGEIFSIIKGKADQNNASAFMNNGVVLTGGGSKMDYALDILRDITRSHVRRGTVIGDFSGSVSGIDRSSPANASIIGLLKYAAGEETASPGGSLKSVMETFENVPGSIVRGFKRFKNFAGALGLGLERKKYEDRD